MGDLTQEENDAEREIISKGPLVRSMDVLIESLLVSESEMWFQVKRLEEHVTARTEEEKQYLDELQQIYRTSAVGLRRLRRYHTGRMERKLLTGSAAPEEVDHEDAIIDGRATAYIGDEDE